MAKSPWVWVGCGCATIVGIGLVLIGAATFLGVRTARTMADPVARQDKALEILSAEAIPADYETELAMSIPFFAEVVLLQGRMGDFVYMKGLRGKGDLEAAFADDDTFDKELRRAGLRVGRRQAILARDALTLGAADVRYALFEGDVDFVAGASFDSDHEDDDDAEISAAILIRCAADETPVLGLWGGRRVDRDADPEDPTADQAAFVDFIEQFGFCRG